MKQFLLLILLFSSAQACTHDAQHRNLLTLSADFNECVAERRGSCCNIFNQLIETAIEYDIEVDESVVCIQEGLHYASR